MSRHDPLVTLKQLLDFVAEARVLSLRDVGVRISERILFSLAWALICNGKKRRNEISVITDDTGMQIEDAHTV